MRSSYAPLLKTILLLTGIFLLFSGNGYAQSGRSTGQSFERFIGQYQNTDPADLASNTLYQLAEAYEETMRFDRAIDLYRIAYERNPEQIYLLNDMARAATKAGLTNEAVSFLEEAVAADESDHYLRYKLAEAYHTAGNYANGSDACNDLLDRGYNTPQVWLLMGQCSQGLGISEAALIQYAEACRQSPRNRMAALKYLNLLLAQRGVDQEYIDQGFVICDSILRYNRSDLDIRLAKGLLHYRSNDFQSAEFIFTELLERGDSLPSVIRYGGLSRVETGRSLEAQPLLELTYERDTTDYNILMALGRSNATMGRRREAEKYLDKAEETLLQEDRHYSIEIARGNLYMQIREWEKAMRHYYTAYSQYNDQNVSLLTLSHRASLNVENGGDISRFLLYTYVRRCFETGHSITGREYYRTELQKMIENAFFEGKETLPLRAPDGRTSTVTVERLRELVQKLEEPASST